jgi:hypothetical protein
MDIIASIIHKLAFLRQARIRKCETSAVDARVGSGKVAKLKLCLNSRLSNSIEKIYKGKIV